MEIVTRKFNLKSVNPNWAKSIADKYAMDEDAIELIRKGVAVDSRSYFKEDEKASVDYITTKMADRDGQIVVPGGIDLSEYRLTPIVLWCHDYKSDLPLGKNIWIKADDRGLIAKTKYYTREGSLGRKVHDYLADGFPLATSIGFVPIQTVFQEDFHTLDFKALGLDPKEVKKARNGIFTKSLLLEYSRVPVASNAHAVGIAVSKGIFTEEEAKEFGYPYEVIDPFKESSNEIETKEEELADGTGCDGCQEEKITKEVQGEVEDPIVMEYKNEDGDTIELSFSIVKDLNEIVTKPDTENYVHIGVSGEEGKHSEHTVRAITISKEKGIKAHYCADCKKITGYLFTSDKWTHEDAQAWVDSHSKSFEGWLTEKDFDLSEDTEYFLSQKEYSGIFETKSSTECTCDSFEGDDDTCKACGGKRKPKKEVEEDACKPKPKKSLDDIISEVMGGSLFNSETFPKVEKGTRWNPTLSKTFDIASVPSKPANYTMAIYCAFLECKVKNIYQNDYFIWSPMMGPYLAGFKACSKNFKLKDTRCFSSYEQLEFPPSYEVIKINSKTSDDFLINGSAFYEVNGEPVILSFAPGMYGMYASVFTSRKNMSLNKEFMESVHNWVEKENPLRDEKMGLNGEFLDIDEKDNWDTIVLSPENLKSSKYAAYLINEKGMDFSGRGMLLVGSPGTGKTKMARILMTQTKHTFIWVSSKDLTDTWYPEKKIALGFKMARQLAPCVLCLEDIDNWIDGKIVDMMKTELDGVKKNKGVVTILTTNNPEKLPSALLDRPGRFHDVLNFDHPSKELRAEMLTRWAGELSEETIKAIVESTEGYSGAYMWELIEFAKDIAEEDELDMGDALVASLLKLSNQKDLIESIRNPRVKSVGEKIIPVGIDEISIKKFEEYAADIVKSGRRLSSTSITTLRQALSIIEELISGSEPKQEEEEKAFSIAPTPEPEFDIAEVLKSSLSDIFDRKLKKLSTEDIVSEAIKKAKGEIF